MLWLLNGMLYGHYVTFLVYLTTLLKQWDRPAKRTSSLMLCCVITLLLTGMRLIAVRYPVINYWKVVPKNLLLALIAGITAAHRDKLFSKRACSC